jgi:hypothetical protein
MNPQPMIDHGAGGVGPHAAAAARVEDRVRAGADVGDEFIVRLRAEPGLQFLIDKIPQGPRRGEAAQELGTGQQLGDVMLGRQIVRLDALERISSTPRLVGRQGEALVVKPGNGSGCISGRMPGGVRS